MADTIIDDTVITMTCTQCQEEFTGVGTSCPRDGSLLVATYDVDPWVGQTLANNYEILEVAGQGGMGVVYKARHALMNRTVAIKMLKAQLISNATNVKRFQYESQAASRIDHPHVVTIYDFGISTTGQPYIVMDFLDGTSLIDIVREAGQCAVERTINVIAQACEALDYAHKQGVIHRDIKPSNIVLIGYNGEKDFVKVVDFGVAKLLSGPDDMRLTQIGDVCGSPAYMSPEQCKGLDLDSRSDIYSMGVVLYEALTGDLPFLGKTMVDTMYEHVNGTPKPFAAARPDLQIPPRLQSVVLQALSKNPDDRQQTMAILRTDLLSALTEPYESSTQSGSTRPSIQRDLEITTTEAPQLAPQRRKAPKVPIAAACALALVCTGIGVHTYRAHKKAITAATAPIAAPHVITPPVPTPAAIATPQAITSPPTSTLSSTPSPSTSSKTEPAATASATMSDANEPSKKPNKRVRKTVDANHHRLAKRRDPWNDLRSMYSSRN